METRKMKPETTERTYLIDSKHILELLDLEGVEPKNVRLSRIEQGSNGIWFITTKVTKFG